jgi:hypothetical protein
MSVCGSSIGVKGRSRGSTSPFIGREEGGGSTTGGGRISIAMKPATSLEIKGRFEGGNRRVIKGEIAVGGASPCLEKLIERGGDARGTVVTAGDRHGITTCGNKGGDKAGGRGRN